MKPGADADTLTPFRASRNRKGSFTGRPLHDLCSGFYVLCTRFRFYWVGTELLVLKAKVDQPRIAQTGDFAQISTSFDSVHI